MIIEVKFGDREMDALRAIVNALENIALTLNSPSVVNEDARNIDKKTLKAISAQMLAAQLSSPIDFSSVRKIENNDRRTARRVEIAVKHAEELIKQLKKYGEKNGTAEN
jgi:hypothetical protein